MYILRGAERYRSKRKINQDPRSVDYNLSGQYQFKKMERKYSALKRKIRRSIHLVCRKQLDAFKITDSSRVDTEVLGSQM